MPCSFTEALWNAQIIEEQYNDCSSLGNVILISLGYDHDFSLDDWNTDEFATFIKSVQERHDVIFNMKGEFNCYTSLKYKADNNMVYYENYSCGRHYSNVNAEITPDSIKALEYVHKLVLEFKNEIAIK
jgi:hypothetical protein